MEPVIESVGVMCLTIDNISSGDFFSELIIVGRGFLELTGAVFIFCFS